jgi:hypothetical protein
LIVTVIGMHGNVLPTADSQASRTQNDSPDCRSAVRLWLVTITLWVDAWQMQCCGEPFRLGSQVAWTLRNPDPDWLEAALGAEASRAVDAAEEHHGDISEDTEPVRGIVMRIRAVHCRYAPSPDGGPRTLCPAPGSGVLTDVESADGWIADRGEERLAGYVVRLDQVNRDLDGDLAAHREAELALLAARFSLPGIPPPDVDRAIDLACRLLAGNLETPATIEVACLSYGTPLRDAGPVLRQMLIEHGMAVDGPETDADQLRVALRAFGANAIGVGEFSEILYHLLPPWNEQDATQRAMARGWAGSLVPVVDHQHAGRAMGAPQPAMTGAFSDRRTPDMPMTRALTVRLTGPMPADTLRRIREELSLHTRGRLSDVEDFDFGYRYLQKNDQNWIRLDLSRQDDTNCAFYLTYLSDPPPPETIGRVLADITAAADRHGFTVVEAIR